MNRKILIYCLFVLPVFFSCGGSDALKYNDTLARYYNETDKYVGNFYNNATRLLQEDKLSELPGYKDAAVEGINNCIEKVNRLEKPQGADAFQKAVVTYMEAQIHYVNTMSDQYSRVTNETAESDFNYIEQAINITLKDRTEKNEAILEAQKDFARKHNFKINVSEK